LSLSYQKFRNLEVVEIKEEELAADDFSNVWINIKMPEMLDENRSERVKAVARRAYDRVPGEDVFQKGDHILDLANKGVSAYEKFRNLFLRLVGKGGEKHVDRLGDIENARQAIKAQKETVRETARKIEMGIIKLKTMDDIQRFKEISKMSDIYRDDGKKLDSDSRIAKHIDIIIARNVSMQIPSKDHSMFMMEFMDSVKKDDFCY
tara:strand:- start:141 stop:758 length:618 start_codon:yes stop_codon:yes gene_type:complete